MCNICTALNLAQDGESPTRSITKNEDGTYTLTLTEGQLNNLVVRLAMSIMAERLGS